MHRPRPGLLAWWVLDHVGALALAHHPETARLALERGIPEALVRHACYENALAAYGQSGQMKEADWLDPPPIDQRTLFEGNSILRGGRDARVEERPRASTLIIE